MTPHALASILRPRRDASLALSDRPITDQGNMQVIQRSALSPDRVRGRLEQRVRGVLQ